MSVSYKFHIIYWGDLDQDVFVEHGSIKSWKEALEKITNVAGDDYKQISIVRISRSAPPGRSPKWFQENATTCYVPDTFPLRWSGTGLEWKAICKAEEEKAEEEEEWCSPECEDSEGCIKCNHFAFQPQEEFDAWFSQFCKTPGCGEYKVEGGYCKSHRVGCDDACREAEGCHKCNIFAYLEMEQQLPQMCALANAVVAAKLDGGKSQG